MVRSLDPSAERFLSTLAQTSRQLERAQREVSSGLRLTTASDDPDNVSPLLQLRAELARTRQIGANMGRVKTEVDTAEQALQSAVSVLDRASVLGAEGATGTQTGETRKSIAGEVTALLEQLVGIAGTQVEGRYVFSGDNDQVAPYAVDLAEPGGVTAYAGSPATRQTAHPSGSLFATSRSAEEIFDDAADGASVFAAVNALRVSLEANDDTGIRAALDGLRRASDHVSGELAFYGSVQNRVQEATDSAGQTETRLQTEIAGIEDADMAAAILEMNQARFQQETSLSSWARLPQRSLFDYLG